MYYKIFVIPNYFMPFMNNDYLAKQARYKKANHILGEGSYKTVYKAVDEEEGKEVACNQVKIKSYEDETKTVSSFSKEIAILKSIDHPNIIKILDYWFTDDDFVFITELMTGGSLKDYLQKNGPLNVRLIRKWGKQILEGLKYLHGLSPPIIHRDVKNDNIFINSATGEIKIGDLGLARERKHKRYTIVGTPHFMAREMFEGEGYTEKVDVYAFGMGLIEMATGKTPYTEYQDTTDIYRSVLQGIFPKALQFVNNNCLKSLIVGCLVPSYYRYTSSQCLDHHFFHPDVSCDGNCLNDNCVSVLPINIDPIKDMELSLISVNDTIISFQLEMLETNKFINFKFNLKDDTVQKVADEVFNEKILEKNNMNAFIDLLVQGVEMAKIKINEGRFQDGMIKLNSSEIAKIKNKNMVISSMPENIKKEIINEGFKKEDSEFSDEIKAFGTKTLEEMQKIEEEMKIMEVKEELERKREEELSQRLKAKLAVKDASFELFKNKQDPTMFGEPMYNPISGSMDISSVDSLIYTNDFSKAIKFREENKIHKNNKCVENVFACFPAADPPVEYEETIQSSHATTDMVNNRANTDINESDMLASNNSDIVFSGESTLSRNSQVPSASSCISPKMSNATICNIQPDNSFSLTPKPICSTCPNPSSLSQKDFPSQPDFPLSFPQSTSNRKSDNTNAYDPSVVTLQTGLINKTDTVSLNNAECMSNTSLKNDIASTDNLSKENYTVSASKSTHEGLLRNNLYPPAASSEGNLQNKQVTSPNLRPCSSIQHIQEDLIKAPSIVSPPFYSSKLTEEQAENNIGLNESYDLCKIKYKDNYSISHYAYDAAAITGRTEDTAKSWLKALKDENIETVNDLKLLVYEDWERLPLTVFSCRAMQNMLYGIDGIPLKEKQLAMNPEILEYDDRMVIKDFLNCVCDLICRKDLVTSWENKLLAQDIRTVGELRSLHHEDWNRLGISVFCYRILKNIIFKKGKILIKDD